MSPAPDNLDDFEMDGGCVRAWVEQESSIHVKIVTREGDPVELSHGEVMALVEGLQRLARRLEELDG